MLNDPRIAPLCSGHRPRKNDLFCPCHSVCYNRRHCSCLLCCPEGCHHLIGHPPEQQNAVFPGILSGELPFFFAMPVPADILPEALIKSIQGNEIETG